MKRLTIILLAALTCSCGTETATVALSLSIPFSQAQTNCDAAYFQSPNVLTARLTLSGAYGECEDIDVDAAQLTVEAFCPEITTDIVRYLSLEYELADSASQVGELLAIVAVIDLRPQAVSGRDSLIVDLTDPTPPAAVLVATPTEYQELPASDATCDAEGSDTPPWYLCDAERWWLDQRATSEPDYDIDDDGVSNIDEACASTLF